MPARTRWSPGGNPPYGTPVEELAKIALGYFHKRKVGDREIWVADQAPEWIRNHIVHPAHGDMMPDDWRYEFIVESLTRITEIEDLDSPELEPDIYTHEYLHWLCSRNDRTTYVDDAISEWGKGDTIDEDIQHGQLKEKEEVYFSVLSSLRKISEGGE